VIGAEDTMPKKNRRLEAEPPIRAAAKAGFEDGSGGLI